MPIGFVPLDSNAYYELFGLGKTSDGYIICRFIPDATGGIDKSTKYRIRVFYI